MIDEFEQYRAKVPDEYEQYRADKSGEDSKGILDNFNNLIEKSGLPAMGGGILQGAVDLASFIPNTIIKNVNKEINSISPGKGNYSTINVDLEKYNKEGILPWLGFKAGEFGIVPGTGGPTALAKLIKKAGSKISFPFTHAFKDMTPYEEAAEKATQKYGEAKEALNETGLSEKVQSAKREQKENQLGPLPTLPPEETEKILTNATAKHQEATINLGNIKNQINAHLNQGLSHDVRTAARADEIINKKKNDIGQMYDTIEKDLENKNITFKNTDTTQQLNEDLITLIKQGKERSPQANDILTRLENVGKDKEIKARDYLSTFRTIRDYARDARRLAYKPGITDEARQEAFANAEHLEDTVEGMKPILEKGIGDENSILLQEANKRWSLEIAPLFKNKLYNKIKFEGRLPDNIIKELRGTGPGMSQLRDIIKKDPELLKNVVGQRYAKKPADIHNPNELTKEYIDAMPELKNLLGKHAEATNSVSEAESLLGKATESHKTALKNDQLTKEISELDKNISILNQLNKNKKISLQEKMHTQNELKRMKNKRSKARTILGTGAVVAGVPTGLKWLGKLLSSNQGD